MPKRNLHKLTIALAAVLIWLPVASGDRARGQDWSPDGKWFTFLTQTGAAPNVLPRGWWARSNAVLDSESADADPACVYLWIYQRDSRRCWKIASSELGLSAPAWSPNTGEIAFVQLEAIADGRVRSAVMLRHGFEPPRMLASCELRGASRELRGLSGQLIRLRLASASATPAWSPLGKFVAVPWFDPVGVAVIRLSDGSVVAKYPDAAFVSWSPDERRLALVLPGESAGYHLTAQDFGPAVPAIETKFAVQPAVWEPAGRGFHVVVWREAPNAASMPPNFADLVRFDVATQRPQIVRQVLTKRPAPSGDPASLYFGRAADPGSLFVVTSGEGHSTDAIELDVARQSVARRHTILDRELVVGSPSFEPGGQTVAVRVGAAESLGTPALFELRTAELHLILPDRLTQLRAAQTIMALVADTTESLVRASDAKSPAWFVRLPSPHTMSVANTRDPRFGERIERLARFGRTALDAEVPDGVESVPRRALVETSLFLNYIAGDYSAALAAADSVEPLLQSNDERLALAVVRVQCCLGAKRLSDARQLLTLLRQKAGRPADDAPPAGSDRSLASTVRKLLDELADLEK